MNRGNIKRLLLVAAAAFCMQSTQGEALLAGVKTTGMAATSVGHPVDAMAGAYNPAGIMAVCNRFDVGMSFVHFKQSSTLRDNLNPALNVSRNGAKTSWAYVPEFGATKCFCYDICGTPIEVGLSLVSYNRSYLKTVYYNAQPLLGTTPTGLEYVNQTISPMIAFRFCNMFSLGISLNYQIQRLKVNGLENFANAVFSVAPDQATNKGYDYSNGVGVTVGGMVEWKCFKVGASYTPKTHMRKFHKYRGFIADTGAFDLPQRAQAGVSYRPFRCLTLAYDYEYVNWRQIRMLRNNIDLPTEGGALLGNPDGTGFGWHNQHFHRFGIEYCLNPCVTLRTGYRHANTPIQNSQTAANLLTLETVEDVFTYGATWHINACNEISLLYVFSLEKEVRGADSVPTSLGGGNVDLTQRLVVFGLSWGKKF